MFQDVQVGQKIAVYTPDALGFRGEVLSIETITKVTQHQFYIGDDVFSKITGEQRGGTDKYRKRTEILGSSHSENVQKQREAIEHRARCIALKNKNWSALPLEVLRKFERMFTTHYKQVPK